MKKKFYSIFIFNKIEFLPANNIFFTQQSLKNGNKFAVIRTIWQKIL